MHASCFRHCASPILSLCRGEGGLRWTGPAQGSIERMVILGPVSATLELLRILGYRYTTLCCWADVRSYFIVTRGDSHGADMEGLGKRGTGKGGGKEGEQNRAPPQPLPWPTGMCSL